MVLLLRPVLATILPLLFTAAAAGGELGDLFYQDFRGSHFSESRLQKVGGDPARQVCPGADGLRITLPAAARAWPQAGIMPRFRISGDFEITLSYELLTLDTPKEGYGAGVKITVRADEGQGQAAVKRIERVSEGSAYVVNRSTVKEGGGLQHHERASPTAARSGKLRLRRSGATMHFLVAEDPKEDDFRELSQAAFGTADIVNAWVVADPGGAHSTIDVLFKDLRCRTEEGSPAGRKEAGRLPVWLGASGLVSLTLLAGFVALLRYRRSLPAPPREAKPPRSAP
jgi:hypothetical protein